MSDFKNSNDFTNLHVFETYSSQTQSVPQNVLATTHSSIIIAHLNLNCNSFQLDDTFKIKL